MPGQRKVSRRSVVSSILGSSLLFPSAVTSQQREVTGAGGALEVPWRTLIGQLAVTAGPYAGAYRATPGGAINWYFANLGLAFLVSSIPDAVRDYLNVYIRWLDPQRNTIMDVSADLVTQVLPDSNDAYAGTFLGLAVKYVRVTGDVTWWDVNLPRLKAIAYCNLLTQIKPNGLVRAFQSPAPNGVGYLMDQCEAYAGLRDFAQYLIEINDVDANYYAAFGMNLGIAIHTLFDANANQWNWCDVPSPSGTAWYPNLTAQIYPDLYDVHSADAVGDYYRLHRGFQVLNSAAPNWMSEPQDLYPWLVVGYYAASHQNLLADARRMLSMGLQYYLPGLVNTGRMLISEFGYAKAIADFAESASPEPTCVATGVRSRRALP